MENLKIKKIGYTTFVTEDIKGKRSFIVVRKNLLSGYTIVDANGIKQKTSDFSLAGLKIHSSSWQLLSNCTLVKSVNESLTLQHAQVVELQAQSEGLKQEKAGLAEQLGNSEQSAERLREQLESAKEVTNQQRQSLTFGLDLACFVNCHHGWEETVYEQPNEYQRNIFSMTCVPRTVYKDEDYQSKLNWELYFGYLLKQDCVSDKCKETLARLKSSVQELQRRVNSLTDKSLSSDYTKAYGMKTSFVIQLRDFFYQYRNEMGNADVYYTYSYTNHLPGDEEDSYVYSAHDIIKESEKYCAKLIESLFGLEEAQKFLQQVEELSTTKNAEQATV